MAIVFMRGKQRFEIRHEPSGDEFAYVGYVDGQRSVAATRADIAARALIKKHIVGLAEAQIVRFPLERRSLPKSEIVSVSGPDLAG